MAKFSITPGGSPSPDGAGELVQALPDPSLVERPTEPAGSTPSILDGPYQDTSLLAYERPADERGWLADVRDDDGLVIETGDGSNRRGWTSRFSGVVRSLRPALPADQIEPREAPVFNDPGLTGGATHLPSHRVSVDLPVDGPVVVVEDRGADESEDEWGRGPVVWQSDEGVANTLDASGTQQVEPARSTLRPPLPAPSFPPPSVAIPIPAEVAVPSRAAGLVGALRTSATEYLDRRHANEQAARELAAWREERAAAEAAAARDALNVRLTELRLQDERTIAGVVDQLAATRAQMGPIEPVELRHLPTLAMVNERVRALTASQLSPTTTEVISEGFGNQVAKTDPGLLELLQTKAMVRQALAANDLAAARSRQPRIDEVTDPSERTRRIMVAANQTADNIAHAQAAILPEVYVNPRPEDGVSHREYAFRTLVEIAGVPEGRSQVIDGTRQTQVLARMEVDSAGVYHFVPGQDGISPLLARCGDASRGESAFLGNVVPGGLDGRASGVVVRRPGDTYPGGFVVEVRYAGKTPIEVGGASPNSGNPLMPPYDALFDVEARHLTPDTYNQVMASRVAGHGAGSPQAFVDPRIMPLFEGQATKDYALTRYQDYATNVEAAHYASTRLRDELLADAGFAIPRSSLGQPSQPELGTGH